MCGKKMVKWEEKTSNNQPGESFVMVETQLNGIKRIAIIPARGGSKRLPKKNIILFGGRPIIHYTIEAAVESGLFDRIAVSTEDREVMECVRDQPCDISRRPPALATDTARVVEVIADVLREYRSRGETFEFLCCLYAPAPLRRAKDITKSHDLMLERGADFCLAVRRFEKSPFFAFDVAEDSTLTRRWPDMALLPAHGKPPLVVDNGSTYWARVSAFQRTGLLYGEKTVGYPMERWQSVDIDTREDLELTRLYAEAYHDRLR